MKGRCTERPAEEQEERTREDKKNMRKSKQVEKKNEWLDGLLVDDDGV